MDLPSRKQQFNSITDRQALWMRQDAQKYEGASLSDLKKQYVKHSDAAKEAKSAEDGASYDVQVAGLLACDYRLKKMGGSEAESFIAMRRIYNNMFFDIVNDDVGALRRAVDNPSFDWQPLADAVEADRLATQKETEAVKKPGLFSRLFGRQAPKKTDNGVNPVKVSDAEKLEFDRGLSDKTALDKNSPVSPTHERDNIIRAPERTQPKK